MGLFSGLTKSDGGEYQNVGSATTSCGGEEPPLVTATPISSSTASASLPTVAEAINISKLAAAGASTAAVGATSALSNATAATHQQSDNSSLGRFPTSIATCPHCRTSNIATKIRTYPTCETWGMIIALFFVFWPVCWFPLVMDSCKTTDHYCTSCNEHVGRVKPLSDCCVKEMG
mmetsp:Transcript_29612/g.44793  ORF Transcript_29612/g.44793 Transcript_29612/m.44793 type:complete len:175 (-) Transcript_29612:1057-1581(-)